MRARATERADPVATAVRAALASPARGLTMHERQLLETRLRGDLGALRVHTGPAVDHAADRLGARGFALGRHAALAATARADTLAHEAAHALQQGMAEPRGTVPVLPADAAPEREARAATRGRSPVTRGQAPFLGRDVTAPGRLGEVHQGVRVEGPLRQTASGGTASRLPWVDGAHATPGTTAYLIHREARHHLMHSPVPTPSGGPTNATNLDADAVTMHRRVLDYFPQISSPLSDNDIQSRVELTTSSTATGSSAALNAWVDNFIGTLSASADDYRVDFSNPNYRAMVTDLITDADTGPRIAARLATHPGFTTGEGRSRQIFVHPRVSATSRQLTLIHEIVHLYRHPHYQSWVEASLNVRHYNEGLTEWLAQRVMLPEERHLRSGGSYAVRVRTVEAQIVPHLSEDGIARAFFQGEVWRLETRSEQARTAFGAQTGIVEGATRTEEIAASRGSAGFAETVTPGRHYRFISLGVDETAPKTEHVETFRTVKRERLDPEPARGVRFVGHASSPGSDAHNLSLARRRAVAFYSMAATEGLSRARLIDVTRPPHFGESLPSVTEEDVITRAMNRRVDMYLIDGGGP